MPRFTDEQYKIARYESSALEYALSQGYELKPQAGGKYYTMADHDSLVFSADGHFYWNSQGINGGAIEFLMYYEEKTLPEAVLSLCGERSQTHSAAPYKMKNIEPVKKAEFQLPKKASSYKHMFSYLMKTRCLNYDVVSNLVKSQRLYESSFTTKDGKSYANAVFVGYDADGKAKSAFQRGCSSFSTFKREIGGSDKTAPFDIPGNADAKTLYVFEAAIDAASHASLYANCGFDYKEGCRLATGGNAPPNGVLNYLQSHPNIENIVLCFDNDNAGLVLQTKLANALNEFAESKGFTDKYEISCVSSPVGKDWNDYCCYWQKAISEYDLIETTQTLGEAPEAAGRFHYVAENGISVSEEIHDASVFKETAKNHLDNGVAVVIETPEQIAPYQPEPEPEPERALDDEMLEQGWMNDY